MKNTIQKREIIPIFFAVDDNYVPYLTVAISSLIDNSSERYNYHINVLIERLSPENVSILEAMQTENVKIDFVNVTQKVKAICSRLHLRDYYTKATYYRFFIPDMFPQYAKGVYLDCDIVITRDIANMYNHDIGSCLVGAITDEVITDIDVFARYSEIVLNIPKKQYFNAGILVMNLREMRRIRIEEVFANLLSEREFRVAQDQDYLNVICHGRTRYLDTTWNKTPMPSSDRNKIPNIAHYKINFKPWRYDNVPYGELFWKYAERTPFYNSLLEIKNNYSKAEMERDQAQYDGLVALAAKEVEDELNKRRNELISYKSEDIFRHFNEDAVMIKRAEAI